MPFFSSRHQDTIRWASFLALGVLLIVLGCGYKKNDNNNGVSIELLDPTQRTLLLSSLKGQEDFSLVVNLKNCSEFPLTLQVQGKSCSCYQLIFAKDSIEPGEKTTLTILASPITSAGTQTFSYLLKATLGNGEQKIIRRKDIVHVLPALKVSPPNMIHGFMAGRNKRTAELTITQHRPASLGETWIQPSFLDLPNEITLSELSGPVVKEQDNIATAIWQAKFVLTKPKSGSSQGRLKIVAQDNAKEIFYRVWQKEGIKVVPSQLDPLVVAINSTASRRIQLIATDSKPFKIENFAIDNEDWKAMVVDSEAATVQYIDVEFSPLTKGESQAKIELRTSHPTSQVVALHLSGIGEENKGAGKAL